MERLKAKGILWFAVVSTVSEAVAAEKAGADVVIAQGAEAGGHRAAFEASEAERRMVGLISLVPAVADAVRHPGRSYGRHRGRKRGCGSACPRRERCAGRHRVPALPGS